LYRYVTVNSRPGHKQFRCCALSCVNQFTCRFLHAFPTRGHFLHTGALMHHQFESVSLISFFFVPIAKFKNSTLLGKAFDRCQWLLMRTSKTAGEWAVPFPGLCNNRVIEHDAFRHRCLYFPIAQFELCHYHLFSSLSSVCVCVCACACNLEESHAARTKLNERCQHSQEIRNTICQESRTVCITELCMVSFWP